MWVPDLSLESLPHAPAGRSVFRYPDGDTDNLLYARGEQKDEAQEFPNGGCTYNGAGCEPDDPRFPW